MVWATENFKQIKQFWEAYNNHKGNNKTKNKTKTHGVIVPLRMPHCRVSYPPSEPSTHIIPMPQQKKKTGLNDFSKH